MLPFRKIVFPVDYSEACRAIVPHVKHAVQHFSAQLTLVHAYGPEGLSFVDLPIATPDLPKQVREFEQLRLSDFAQEVFPGVHVDCFAELGEPGTVIQNVLHRQGGDLVMLPTHGRGPIRRLMLGSVTTKVLHDSSVAVWTATAAAIAAHPAGAPKSIVCAVDDSEEALSVLKAGSVLAKSYGARLAAVHVLGLPPMSMEIDYAAIKKDLLTAAQQRLRETLASLEIDAPYAVIEGNIASSLHDWAAERGADLLVVGRGHAQGALGRVWSNLYSIVRESPCPVLSI
jgi:nucleotide-binding universal stress UspA family protein